MRVVFFGTPEPAAMILRSLAEAGHEIVCVVTQPDRPRGRGQKLSFSPVKEEALRSDFPLEQPETLKDNKVFASLLSSLNPDIGVIVAYGKILPKMILDVPAHGLINVHASLLPKYRGAAPIQWALLAGEKETGITIFKLTESLDAGPMLAQAKVAIEDEDDARTLSDKLFRSAPSLLNEVLGKIEKGAAEYVEQKEEDVVYAPALEKESGEIDWRKKAFEINNRVRALTVWPGAHTFFRGKRLKVTKAKPVFFDLTKRNDPPGTILQVVKDEGMIVACGEGILLLSEVQPEGGKVMRAHDFAIGHDVKTGEILPS